VRKQEVKKQEIILSKNLIDILISMDSPISKLLLNSTTDGTLHDKTYIDISNIPGRVTFLKSENVTKIEYSEFWKTNQREEPTKFGKIISKLFLNKIYNGNKIKEVNIEKFVNEFISKTEITDNKFKMVYGSDVLKYYREDSYSELKSTLGASCMRQHDRNHYLEIYGDNTEDGDNFSHIGMLIYLDDNNKITARALVWFNSIKPEPNRIFMDRIYYTHDKYINIFIDYAKKQNWLYKKQQTYNNNDYIDPSNDNKVSRLTMTFRLKNKNYDTYPYFDTLSYYTPKTGRLSSKPNRNKKFKSISLRSTNGGYSDL